VVVAPGFLVVGGADDVDDVEGAAVVVGAAVVAGTVRVTGLLVVPGLVESS
jgi:hypothetical protein